MDVYVFAGVGTIPLPSTLDNFSSVGIGAGGGGGLPFKSLTLKRTSDVLPPSLSNSKATSPDGSSCILECPEVMGQICRDRLKLSPLLSLASTAICTRALGECGPAYKTVLPPTYKTDP